MDHKRQAAAQGHKERTGPVSTVGNYETGASGPWQTFVLSDMKTKNPFSRLKVYNHLWKNIIKYQITGSKMRLVSLIYVFKHNFYKKQIPVGFNNPTCSRYSSLAGHF